MPTQYKMQRDVAGYNGFGLQPSDLMLSATLAATTNTQLTVPNSINIGAPVSTVKNRFIALINVSFGEEVWVAVNQTAAVPAGASFAATDSQMIVGTGEWQGIVVNGNDVLNFYTAGTSVAVSVKLYSVLAQ